MGGGAHEVGDLCLFEGGSKRDGTLLSEAAAGETAKEVRGEMRVVREQACQWGADTKANTLELVREAGGLLERLQRRNALKSLGESSSPFGAEHGALQTASTGVKRRVL